MQISITCCQTCNQTTERTNKQLGTPMLCSECQALYDYPKTMEALKATILRDVNDRNYAVTRSKMES